MIEKMSRSHWHHDYCVLTAYSITVLERKNGVRELDVVESEVLRWSSWRNRAWIRKSWAKGREFKKKVLSLPTILKINNGLNGYAPKLVNGYRPEYACSWLQPRKTNGYVPEYVGNHDAAEDAAVIYTLWAAASWHRSTYANGWTIFSHISMTMTRTTHATCWNSFRITSSRRASSEILLESSENPGLIPRILEIPVRFWKSL